jgi:hypothetical protein
MLAASLISALMFVKALRGRLVALIAASLRWKRHSARPIQEGEKSPV